MSRTQHRRTDVPCRPVTPWLWQQSLAQATYPVKETPKYLQNTHKTNVTPKPGASVALYVKKNKSLVSICTLDYCLDVKYFTKQTDFHPKCYIMNTKVKDGFSREVIIILAHFFLHTKNITKINKV